MGSTWAKWRLGAEYRNMEFTIKIEDAWEKFLSQKRKCALSGIPITFHKKYKDKFQTASLDRIDSNKDYTPDNIQWLHKDINIMKGFLDEKKFLNYCKIITENENFK